VFLAFDLDSAPARVPHESTAIQTNRDFGTSALAGENSETTAGGGCATRAMCAKTVLNTKITVIGKLAALLSLPKANSQKPTVAFLVHEPSLTK